MSSTRRKFLRAISQLTAVLALVGCGRKEAPAAAKSRESDLNLLAGVAYDLLPFSELPDRKSVV